MIEPWVLKYVGIPFETAKCFGLIKRVYQDQFDIELPDYADGTCDEEKDEIARIMDDVASRYTKVLPGEEKLGDVLTFWVRKPELVMHCAMVLEDGLMLNATNGRHSEVVTYLSGFWAKRRVGIYRHEQL